MSSSQSSSPAPTDLETSPLRSLLFRDTNNNNTESLKSPIIIPKIEIHEDDSSSTNSTNIVSNLNSLNHDEELLFKNNQKDDHQLLREVLRDTSFQRKYNLRPVDLGSVGTGFVEDMENNECVGDVAREQIEPVLSLAMQQLQKDFDNTCVALGIHPG